MEERKKERARTEQEALSRLNEFFYYFFQKKDLEKILSLVSDAHGSVIV